MGIEIRDTMLKKEHINELTTGWRSEETYIARGAYIYCSNGTHEEILNQPKTNGVYINKNPMMTVKDCRVTPSNPIDIAGVNFFELGDKLEGNFRTFGLCRSKHHPFKKLESMSMFPPPFTPVRDAGCDYDPDEKVSNDKVLIYPCIPQIGSEWEEGSKNVFIEGNAVLTTKSCLSCALDGEIRFLTNGMDPAPYDMVKHQMK